jgi:hypothetical protein
MFLGMRGHGQPSMAARRQMTRKAAILPRAQADRSALQKEERAP